jgi:hypothetical protein
MAGEWTLEAVQALKTMAHNREPASAIAMRLRMDLQAVRDKLLQLGIASAPDLRESDRDESGSGDTPRPAAEDEVRLHTM